MVRFFVWCDHYDLAALVVIEPLHVAAYIEALQHDFVKPSVKRHLAAISLLFDWLVTDGIVATNPAHAVCGPKHVVKGGKTSVPTGDQVALRHPWPAPQSFCSTKEEDTTCICQRTL